MSTEYESNYDIASKGILSNKYILAWILKSVVEELKDISIEDIVNNYIIEDVNESNIIGLNTENVILGEGRVAFDIYFKVIRPDTEGKYIYCDLESQNDYYPGYDHVTRGIYNCARMISTQYNTEFSKSHYEKIKKVYSIWICMQLPNKHKNSISKIRLEKRDIVSQIDRKKEVYDLLTVVSICLGGPEYDNYNGIIKLLDVLLMSNLSKEEKRRILETEFNIPINYIEKEVDGMSSTFWYLYEKAKEEVKEQVTAEVKEQVTAEVKEQVTAEVKEQEKRKMINILIQDNISEGKSEENIMPKLCKFFKLDENTAREYIKKCSMF